MQAEKRKLARLHRLERLRAIAKQAAASEAARAEATLSQLALLAERTGQLAADYAARTDAEDGAALGRIGRFAGSLQGLRAATEADVSRARAIADERQSQLATAERRRAAVEDRAEAQARQLAARRHYAVLAGRRGFGTKLD
ncbi:MAG TPA: hypothetical protein VFF98_12020 [Novosphingobium sp.]|nr:hypothetical protein [Novosphingobium sp.]